jgi:hypothetical protein
MPDSPRVPEKFNDLPSSRHPESEPVSAGHFSGESHHADATHSTTTKVHLKNLLLGALVTILTSIIVYYITQVMNKESDTSDFNRIKDITVAAWKSYTVYENTYTKNILTYESAFVQNGDFSAYSTGLKTESEKFNKDITVLAATKNLDKDLVSILNRRMDNDKNMLDRMTSYFATLQGLVNDTAHSLHDRNEKYLAEEIRWNDYYKGEYVRSVNDIQEIAKSLTDKYKESFSTDDFLVIQIQAQRAKTTDSLTEILRHMVVDSTGRLVRGTDEQGLPFLGSIKPGDFTGSWNADGQGVSFTENGQMSWTLTTGEKASGTWQIQGDRIMVNAITEKNKKNVTWYFKLSNLTNSTFTLTNAAPPYDFYHLVRIRLN